MPVRMRCRGISWPSGFSGCEEINRPIYSLMRQIQISRYRPDITPRTEVAALLAEAVGNPTAGKLEEVIESCTQDDYPGMWIADCSEESIGVMRLDSQDRSHCTITHIAVRAKVRSQGVGRILIEFIRDELKFDQAEAETDDDALGFYKACGYEIESIGENSYGTQRYRCVVRF